ncbi:conserved protein of unknown function [Ectopseudomonas oleovorans]|uniref:Uncharacterized protein n=1 Tax=Ectopseudomonas oleovorans TaxID=301 RepID=A0A653B814_ECTOL|nr:conserved protein of unknown function [Pseudomonas oleovorans]
MSHAALFAVALLITLLALSFWLTQRQEARQQSARLQQHRQVAQRCLDLLQALQLHRGLGAMLGAGKLEQRTRVARQLDDLWLNWPGASLQLPALQQDWPQLRRKPGDFDAHCRLIEALLAVIEQLEDRLYRHDQPAIRGLGEACRSLEDLSRLRGLAVRAASYERCPPGLQMQLRFLCERLLSQQQAPPLQALIERLQTELIESSQVQLSPDDCFALLTPLIEQRLQGIRLGLD